MLPKQRLSITSAYINMMRIRITGATDLGCSILAKRCDDGQKYRLAMESI